MIIRHRLIARTFTHALLGSSLAIHVGGCVSRPELVSLREGMNQATATIRQQHLAWAKLMSESKQSELPTLSPADYQAVLTAHEEYNALVNASRAQDGDTGIVSGAGPTTGSSGTTSQP